VEKHQTGELAQRWCREGKALVEPNSGNPDLGRWQTEKEPILKPFAPSGASLFVFGLADSSGPKPGGAAKRDRKVRP